jgi:hypothetical protein
MAKEIIKVKKAQVTLFIIIAIVIVAVIAFFFIAISGFRPNFQKPEMQDPQAYIEKCARDAASEAIDIMLPQGGYISPTNYKLYQDNKIAYLCYTNLYYLKCKIEEPMYIEHLQNEITGYIQPKIENCFSNLKSTLEEQGYSVNLNSNINVKSQLATGVVRINIEKSMDLQRNGQKLKFENFKASLNSPLSELAFAATEIANQEAKYCYFEYLGFMLLYPSCNIDKKSIGQNINASKIYSIEDRYTGKKLNIAIRSCAIPALL